MDAQESARDVLGSLPQATSKITGGSVADNNIPGDATQTTLPVLDHHNITLNRHARGQSDHGFIKSGDQNISVDDQRSKVDDQQADGRGIEADSIQNLRPQKKLL